MSRHASAEELASLSLSALKRRKAARIRAHLSQCAQCAQVNNELAAVPDMLASVQYPAMPADLSARVSTALSAESMQRLTSEPASEAGRRDLPRRSRTAGQERRGWRLPGMSPRVTGLVAAAGAIVIIGGGGYEIASHSGGNVSNTASSSGATLPQSKEPSLGPQVTYGSNGSARTIQTVSSGTNFVPSRLGVQTFAAVRAARLTGAAGGVTAPRASSGPLASKGTNSTASGAVTGSQLAGCLNRLAAGRTILLVELAKFEDKPATIIVAAPSASHQAEVWVVSDSCSASRSDVLDHLQLAHI